MECQLTKGSLTAVPRIFSGGRSSQPEEFFMNAHMIGFLLWEDPATIRGIREVFPRR